MEFRSLYIILLFFLYGADVYAQDTPYWYSLKTGSKASLRGLAAVSEKVCWASGSEGTVLRTVDGGQNWQDVSVPGMSALQFRDIQAFGPDTALILSAGLPAIICRTTNGGQIWDTVFYSVQEGLFFDAFDFWNQDRGIAFSDAPKDQLYLIETMDGGKNWTPLPPENLPRVLPKQGGFAASGTCLKTFGPGKVIIGLGGAEATVLVSEDYGRSWYHTVAPLDQGEPSKGIFSFDFINEKGFCVGGDYQGDSLTRFSIAKTTDGGKRWTAVKASGIFGEYRSCIAYIDEQRLVATSRNGCSYSKNGGRSWQSLSGSFYTVSVGKDGAVWASGPEGKVGILSFR